MSAIDEYLVQISKPERTELERIRKLVHKIVPDAQEVISYGMPGFKYKNKYLIGFSRFKDHLSLFPTATPIVALKDKLTNFTISKGTIQFTLDHPIPEALAKEILSIRVADINKGLK